MGPDSRFDSTRGFPGEGPEGKASIPWFLAVTTTRDLVDGKRRKLESGAATIPPTTRRLDFGAPFRRAPASGLPLGPPQADTALARFLKARNGCSTPSPLLAPAASGDTPVPRLPSRPTPAFACLRELQDFTNPLPPIPAGASLRKAFIIHFGGLHGMDAASFADVWRAAKNGYNQAHDAHFRRFHADFLAHNPADQFHPTGIKPGALVGFLRRERERGAAHPTLKDASASVATACAQASDGQVQLGTQDSVIRFLKMAKQSEAPDRKERMIVYPDVARLIQIAWQFGPNANIDLAQLKRKLVLLLMVDTAARPSDLWRVYCTTVGKYRQIEFFGDSEVRIRYFWPKEVDPFSSRTNATNTWFSQWVVVRSTTPASTDTVSCLRDYMARTADPAYYAAEYITQLASSVQPLFFAKTKDGVRQKCSVDHISVIVKAAILQAHITTMKPRHLRGASTSKIVALSPTALPIALGLGRWTTGRTFFQHYNAPVTLLADSERPESIGMHGQQLLRWGWDPIPPPLVTTDEYDSPSEFWVGQTIPRLGHITKFDEGRYSVARRQVTHCDLMGLISSARSR